jgi:hypothetical protein
VDASVMGECRVDRTLVARRASAIQASVSLLKPRGNGKRRETTEVSSGRRERPRSGVREVCNRP